MDRLILDEQVMNPEHSFLARLTVGRVSRQLGMCQAPPIKFFHPSDEDRERGLLGFYSAGIVYLNCRLSLNELLSTARHEARRAFQDQDGKVAFRKFSHEARDRAAKIFEFSQSD
jgi:hypothetical protein